MKKIYTIIAIASSISILMYGDPGKETQYKELNKLHKDSIIRRTCVDVKWHQIGKIPSACKNIDDELNRLFIELHVAKNNQENNIKTKFIGGSLQPMFERFRESINPSVSVIIGIFSKEAHIQELKYFNLFLLQEAFKDEFTVELKKTT